MKVPDLRYLRRDSHTSFKVKRSKVRVTDGQGHANPAAILLVYSCLIVLLFCRVQYAPRVLVAVLDLDLCFCPFFQLTENAAY